MESDVAARTLSLLTLLQTRPTWTAAQLAERLAVPPRTLRRDLQRLGALGYEVTSRPGPGGHYRLAAGTRLPPMVFDDDEVLALVAGLRMAEDGATAEAAARALVKLRQVLPSRLAALAGEITDASETLALGEAPAAGHQRDLLGPLTQAAAADLLTSFAYTSQHGTESQRTVDSLRCLYARGRWYLLAYDLDRADWRIFRLDRIRDVATGGPAPRRDPPAEDLAAWLRTDFGRLDHDVSTEVRRPRRSTPTVRA